MRLLLQSAMIFFGTLFAAALLALGEPTGPQAPARHQQTQATGSVLPAFVSWHDLTAAAQAVR